MKFWLNVQTGTGKSSRSTSARRRRRGSPIVLIGSLGSGWALPQRPPASHELTPSDGRALAARVRVQAGTGK